MKIYQDLADFKPQKSILTIGTFDGVHLGHRKIIHRIIEIAKLDEAESVLLTFHPHPRHVLFPDAGSPKLLSTLEEKMQLLANCGLENLIIYPFTKEFSRMPAVNFVRDLMVNGIKCSKVVVGYDHHFARNREGNLNTLQELAPLYDYQVEEISAQEIDHVNISSTKIRNALIDGDVIAANKYLGYYYRLSGLIVEGKKMGRQLGFPTANIRLDESLKLIPGDGVYAVKVYVDGIDYVGMMSIGKNPTIDELNQDTHLEVNIFDFDRDIYKTELTVEFIARIRSEKKFDDLDSLKQKMHEDKQRTLEIFQTVKKES